MEFKGGEINHVTEIKNVLCGIRSVGNRNSQEKGMKKSRLITKAIQVAALFIISSSTAMAIVVYQYTGHTYTEILSPNNPYDYNMSITGSFTVAAPMENFSGVFTPLSWSYNDGVHTLTSADHIWGQNQVTTDASGMPTAWAMIMLDKLLVEEGDLHHIMLIRNTGDTAEIEACMWLNTACGGTPAAYGDSSTAGNWEVSNVPVPAAVWLFGSGLLGLVGIARRKKAA